MLDRKITAIALLVGLASTVPIVHCLSTVPSQTTRREALVRAAGYVPAAFLLADAPTAARALDLSQFQDGPEGLKYEVTAEGSGAKPERGQEISTSYTLWINGFPGDAGSKRIDSSSKPIVGDQPFKVRAGVSQVIRGWDLTLMDMKVGEARRLVVPSSLGYGDKGVGPIPGKATLYFEMKLTKMEPAGELTDEAKKWLEEHPL